MSPQTTTRRGFGLQTLPRDIWFDDTHMGSRQTASCRNPFIRGLGCIFYYVHRQQQQHMNLWNILCVISCNVMYNTWFRTHFISILSFDTPLNPFYLPRIFVKGDFDNCFSIMVWFHFARRSVRCFGCTWHWCNMVKLKKGWGENSSSHIRVTCNVFDLWCDISWLNIFAFFLIPLLFPQLLLIHAWWMFWYRICDQWRFRHATFQGFGHRNEGRWCGHQKEPLGFGPGIFQQNRTVSFIMGVSKNRGPPKWMIYNGNPY